jgi:hypothetical protein
MHQFGFISNAIIIRGRDGADTFEPNGLTLHLRAPMVLATEAQRRGVYY